MGSISVNLVFYFMNKPALWLALTASLALPACSFLLNNVPGVYKLDIEQGNMIEQSQVDQLRPNMNKRQVLFIMGSPMLSDSFHDNRWDYIYAKQPGGEDRVQKRLTLLFNGETLIGMQGDYRPGAAPATNKASTETSIDLPKRELDQTLWEKLTGAPGTASQSLPTTKP